MKKEFRDFSSTKDICRAIKILLDNRYCGLINICSSQSTCLNDIVKFFKGDIKKIKNKQSNINSKKKFQLFNWK